MNQENVKAIELQGIVHNTTKIGVQDGQCEDLLNLRFKDGAWRSSGDGKRVFSMNYQTDIPNTKGVRYTQLFIHTNVYRHILGVRDNALYWFGNIDTDGVFEALGSPHRLVSVSGNLYISQTGNLLTVIDTIGSFEYLLFKSSTNDYQNLSVDENGKQSDRTLYPFGQIHFNYTDGGSEGAITVDKTGENGWRKWGESKDWGNAAQDIYIGGGKLEELSGGGVETLHNTMVKMYGDILEKNYFTDPFLVCAAIKLYDGKYLYASAPTMIFPRQRAYNTTTTRCVHREPTDDLVSGYDEIVSSGGFSHKGALLIPQKQVSAEEIGLDKGIPPGVRGSITGAIVKEAAVDITSEIGYAGKDYTRNHARQGGEDVLGAFRNGICAHTYCAPAGQGAFITHGYTLDGQYAWQFEIRGCNLCVSIDSTLIKTMQDNRDIFKSLCIFVTPQSSVYKMETKDKGECRVTLDSVIGKAQVTSDYTAWIKQDLRCSVANMSYIPKRRDDKDIRYDLLHSPFYLLREYSQDELPALLRNPIVDLQDPKYNGVLKNITQQEILQVESMSRYSYIPKAQYVYNGRLHIANFTQTQFHGYPIDTFHLNNHALQVSNGAYFKGTLQGVCSWYDDTLSAPRKDYSMVVGADTKGLIAQMKNAGEVLAYAETEIETNDGIQRVSRYIPVRAHYLYGGVPDFIETLDTLISFPDSRAKSITIQVLCLNLNKSTLQVFRRKFDLEPHSYLNIAYFMSEDLLPNHLSLVDSKNLIDYKPGNYIAPSESNATEDYPNKLKVSSTENPLYFPMENTYQIGSAEIVALMSNSVAVGTGQTGTAPLYIFCKDGVYAMFVDSSGKMAYSNSRVLARDVCNNAKSVIPIDTGVVFTTDRGLMSIAGSDVEELGQPLEGDWVRYATLGHIDYSKIACNAYYMQRIAGLPDVSIANKDSMTQTDFLTYLKGCVINYNHNERELMISNPTYGYTYILDRGGNWSRRDYCAEEYVNNYPTSYRVENGEWYQVDTESDSNNGIFVMSHILKLGSIGFKELHRLVIRGRFITAQKANFQTTIVPETETIAYLKGAEFAAPGEKVYLSSPLFNVESEFEKDVRDIEIIIPEQIVYSQDVYTTNLQTLLRTIRTKEDIKTENKAVRLYIKTGMHYDVCRFNSDTSVITTDVRIIRNSTGEDILKTNDYSWITFDTDVDFENDGSVIVSIAPQSNDDEVELQQNETYRVEVRMSAKLHIDVFCKTEILADNDIQIDNRPRPIDTRTYEAIDIPFGESTTMRYYRKELVSAVSPTWLFYKYGDSGNNSRSLLTKEHAIPATKIDGDRYNSGYKYLTDGTYYSKIIVPSNYNTQMKICVIGLQTSNYNSDNTPLVSINDTHQPFEKEEQLLYNSADFNVTTDVEIGGESVSAHPTITPVHFINIETSEVNQQGSLYSKNDYVSKLGKVHIRLYNTNNEIVWSATSSAVFFDKHHYIMGDDGMLHAGNYNNEFIRRIGFTFNDSNDIVTLPAGEYEFRVEFDGFSLLAREDVSFRLVAPLLRITCEEINTGKVYYQGGVKELYGSIENGSLFSTHTIIPEHTEQVADPKNTIDTILGLYVFGSYDGRKWACLGHREKSGDFRDIGTLVERTDCRFFRFVLAGRLNKNSRIDYVEVSYDSSKLNTKIR